MTATVANRLTRRGTLRLGLGLAAAALFGSAAHVSAKLSPPYVFSDTWGDQLGLKHFCDENGGTYDTSGDNLVYCHFDNGGVTCDISADQCTEDWTDRGAPSGPKAGVQYADFTPFSVSDSGGSKESAANGKEGSFIVKRER